MIGGHQRGQTQSAGSRDPSNVPKPPRPVTPCPSSLSPGEREEGEGSCGEGFRRDYGSPKCGPPESYNS
jgi:hypothetical protein